MSQPPEDRVSRGVRLLQTITPRNVLTAAAILALALPTYLVWKIVNDETLLDKLLSAYEEVPDQSGCLLRHVKARGGPDQWSVSTAFAVAGVDRYFVSVIVSHPPTPEEVIGYCETVKLLADQLVSRPDHGDVLGG